MRFSTQTLARFAGIYSGLVFGIYWIPLRALDAAGFSGLWATFIFNAVPLVLITPLALYRWRAHRYGSARFHFGGMLMGLAYVLYASAFLYTEVIRVVLLFYLMPVWGFLLARIFIGEAITAARWLSMALGIAGLLVIFGIESGLPTPGNSGDWMALAAGWLWAVASLMLLTDTPGKTLDYGVLFFFWSTLLAAVFAMWLTYSSTLPLPAWRALPELAYWLVPFALLVLIPAAFATVFGPAHLNPGIVGLLYMTEISVGVSTAAWLAGEPFGLREISGVVLITLAGLAEPLSNLIFRRNKFTCGNG